MNQHLREKGLTVEGIAQALGVSKTTVSRALSGKGRVSGETRARVREFVDRDGRTNRPPERRCTGTLMMVIPRRFIELDLPFVRGCLKGIGYAAEQWDYDLLMCLADGNDVSRLERQLSQRKADGAVLFQTLGTKDPCMALLRRYNLPYVVLGRSDDDSVLQMDSDNAGAAREMTQLLLQMGVRRIAYLYDDADSTVNIDRLRGYTQGLKEAGMAIDRGLIYPNLMTEAQRVNALESALGQRADCLLCCDDRMAVCISTLMAQREIPCPGRMRLASLYDSEILQWNSITAVQFDSVALGASACRLLLDSIGNRAVVPRQVQQYQIILRESTK